MKKVFDITIGFLGGLAFLGCGVAILVWGIGKLQQARASRDWPQVEGTVTHSEVDRSSKESQPAIKYIYTVAGNPYSSRQISFAPFDKPGGDGHVETIIDRYPVDKKVTVYYDPDDPNIAILEPEIYSPFFMPLFFGVLFVCSGCYMLSRTHQHYLGKMPGQQPGSLATRTRVMAILLSVLFYLIITLISFEPGVKETAIKAFGERPLGMPNLLFVLALQTLLYLPIPWVLGHVSRLAVQATQDGHRPGITYLLTVSALHPELRQSQFISIGGLLYFIAICMAWIAYTSAIGI